MDSIDLSGKAFLDHWRWAADKGVMNRNTAQAFLTSCRKVMEVVEGREELDMRTADVEDILVRFQNLRGREFKPQTLETYKRRFRQAVTMFLKYVEEPETWRPSGTVQRSGTKKRSTRRNELRQDVGAVALDAPSTAPQAIEYRYPLTNGRIALLTLPTDLSMDDVVRLRAFVTTLALDFRPEDAARSER